MSFSDKKSFIKSELGVVLTVIVCLIVGTLLWLQPSIFPASKPSSLKILDVAPYVRQVGKATFCIDSPELHKLYYVMTFETEAPTSIRLSTEKALLPGTIMICEVGGDCRTIRSGFIAGLRPGRYKLYIGTDVYVTTLCVSFVG